jgi:hypothetical protein
MSKTLVLSENKCELEEARGPKIVEETEEGEKFCFIIF